MRFKLKHELLESVEREHQSFVKLLTSVPTSRYRDAGVWGDGWTICDLLAHLTEWEQMFLRWYQAGGNGERPIMPAPGYKWNGTPRLNQAMVRKRGHKPIRRVLDEFEGSYREILSVIQKLSQEALLVPGHFAWTGKYPLTTYLAPNNCKPLSLCIEGYQTLAKACHA